jgi:hypothetical protein
MYNLFQPEPLGSVQASFKVLSLRPERQEQAIQGWRMTVSRSSQLESAVRFIKTIGPVFCPAYVLETDLLISHTRFRIDEKETMTLLSTVVLLCSLPFIVLSDISSPKQGL